tara:strand:+ start:417 stop:569 length:153 start_codon:yes stop_codon:yes gene_type:complete
LYEILKAKIFIFKPELNLVIIFESSKNLQEECVIFFALYQNILHLQKFGV